MTCLKNYWGTCFQQFTTYMSKKKRKKYLRSSHVDGKREIACSHVETATGKREKWRENRGHVVIFAVRISRIRDAKLESILEDAECKICGITVYFPLSPIFFTAFLCCGFEVSAKRFHIDFDTLCY